MKIAQRFLALLGFFVLARTLPAQLPAQLPTSGAGAWVDLTHAFSKDTLYWPTADKFVLETVFAGRTEKGFFYTAKKFSASEHGGTHLDAPIHFAEGRQHADELSLDKLIGPAVCIDVSKACLANRDHQISVADIETWEKTHGAIPANTIILLHTGFGRHWPDAKKYLGTDVRGPAGVALLSFPGLAPATARWLVEKRSPRAVGLDTASIDFGKSEKFETHVILMGKNIPVFENVAALDRIPATGAQVVALPMKIKGGSGGPLRIVAWVPGK
ncbi:MAG: cyclase family protein [Verrucomicrobiota bacterium]